MNCICTIFIQIQVPTAIAHAAAQAPRGPGTVRSRSAVSIPGGCVSRWDQDHPRLSMGGYPKNGGLEWKIP